MKKVWLASLISAAMVPAVAVADSKNFSGFSLYGALNHSSTTVELKYEGTSFNGLGKQSISGALGADYGFALGQSSVLLVGATYDLSNPEFLKASSSDTTLTGKVKQRYSVYLAPGVTVSPQTMLYAKLSYESGKAELSASGESESETFRGVGYGFGIRTFLDKNIFAGVEVARINYNDKGFDGVNVGTGTTIGSVQLGYKF